MQSATYKSVRSELDFSLQDTPSLLQIALFIAFVAMFCVSFAHGAWWSYLISQLFLALVMNHAYFILHECSHSTFLRNRAANDMCGHVSGVFALLPFKIRKYEHLHHHSWSQNVDNEPAIQRAMETFSSPGDSLKMKIIGVAWRFWIPVFVINEHVLLWLSAFRGDPERSAAKNREIRRSAIFTAIALVGLAALIGPAATVAMLPGALLYFLLVEVVNLPHHFDSPIYAGDRKKKLWQHDEITESCTPIPFVSSVMLFNFNYHTEHHIYPQAPWYRLPQLHQKLVDLDRRYAETTSEIGWNITRRRQPIQAFLGKYQELRVGA